MSEVRQRVRERAAAPAEAWGEAPDEAPEVEQALAGALAHLLAAVRSRDDGVLDARTAGAWTERTAGVLGRLTPAGRHRLGTLFRQVALREPEGPTRDALLDLPAGLGLYGDEDRHGGRYDNRYEYLRESRYDDLRESRYDGRHARYCDAVEGYVARLVATVRDADPAAPVPTCPGWTLADLVLHVGTVHRWTEHLVGTRATRRVRTDEVPLGLPGEPGARADWLARGAAACLRTLRAADPQAAMWSHGADPHVRFFPRRLLFEAVVHLADAELALGEEPVVEPGLAADGVEEFLENLPYVSWVAEPVSQLGRDGDVLRLCATDGASAWTITLGGGGFSWSRQARAAAEATATVSATAGDLLLYLYGRYRADERRLIVRGDRTLVDAWSTATRY
ncbi:maleylpyruvate isomerase family mycothiol-dependent enzyme [Streptomyces sp. NPDC051310]|uniref:maleylpyruvate isomerase family mycothiol-dependent enzyme n=1 Tax=Streptomyces sp. NPDC051310 TaxID=3365649 RepID=UPI00379C9CE3